MLTLLVFLSVHFLNLSDMIGTSGPKWYARLKVLIKDIKTKSVAVLLD